MKKFFKKVFNTVCTGIGWLFAIPFAISIFLMFTTGLIVGIFDTSIVEKIGHKLGVNNSNKTAIQIEDLEQLKTELKDLLTDIEENDVDYTLIRGNSSKLYNVSKKE